VCTDSAVGSKEPTGAPEHEIKVTPAMLRDGARVLEKFYLGDGIYDLQEECLAAIYRAMNEAR
jgi:hypothetical protein